jgi:hypothetical protein
MKISCTYLTIYKGNRLPPFYIGVCCDIKRIEKGYRGSVASRDYRSIWWDEIKNHPELFKTIILTQYSNYEEASAKEKYFHQKLKVVKNSLYTNKAVSITGRRRGWKHTEEAKAIISVKKRGRPNPKSPEHREKLRLATAGKKRKPHSEETKAKMRAAKLGKKRNPKTTLLIQSLLLPN